MRPQNGLTQEDERIIAALPPVPTGLNDEALVTKPSKRLTATYQYAVRAPQIVAKEWEFIAAYPPELPGQSAIMVRSQPGGTRIAESGGQGRPLWRARAPVTRPDETTANALELTITAQLAARWLTLQEGAPLLLDDTERKWALRASPTFDYLHPTIRGWLIDSGLLRKRDEGEIALARRLFQAIVQRFRYDYTGDQQNRTAPFVCTAGKSDCGGLATLFVTALRAQGIPARTRAGRWAQSAKPGERQGTVAYFQEHIKAEFFADGAGWVPVDLSSAILHDKTKAKLTYFGYDPGDFLTLHLDTDLSFATTHFGVKTMTLLQKPSYWIAGEGDVSTVTITESWKVVALPS